MVYDRFNAFWKAEIMILFSLKEITFLLYNKNKFKWEQCIFLNISKGI